MTTIAMEQARRRWQGVAFMCAGVFVFTIQDLIIKDISGLYPVHEIVFVRSFVVLPVILLIAHIEHGLRRLWTARLAAHVVRSVIMFLAYTSYYLGIAALPLATAVAISFSSPLFITALAVPLLGERVGPVRWAAVFVGFIGVVIVMWDKLGAVELAVLLPVVSAFCYALSQLHARYMGATESGAALSFYLTIVFFVLSGLAGLVTGSGAFEAWSHPSLAFLLRPWSWPASPDLMLMLVCGVVASVGVYCLAQGYRMAEANEAALFEYTALPWAILWGFLFFSEVPRFNTFIGVALVILASLSIAWRERRLA
jgi:drug/metabolite transporter (DMT)-like permease